MAPERDPFNLLPIKQVDVYREVFGQLDRLIRSLQPGARLEPERVLADQLQVSRISVREALRALESMGKIEIRRNAGAFVIDPDGTLPVEQLLSSEATDATSLQWLTDLRVAIDTRVVELVGRQERPTLSPVRDFLERAAAELDTEDTAQGSLDLRFEATLGQIAGNPLLARVQKWVHQAWVAAWSAVGAAPGDRRSLHEEHVAILAALEAGDTELSVRRMEDHVDRRVKGIGPADESSRA